MQQNEPFDLAHVVATINKEFKFDQVQSIHIQAFIMACEMNLENETTDGLADRAREHMSAEIFQRVCRRLMELCGEEHES